VSGVRISPGAFKIMKYFFYIFQKNIVDIMGITYQIQ